VVFPAFDREAMFAASRGRTLDELLDEFATLRRHSLDKLCLARVSLGAQIIEINFIQ
jgi:hypothetical protein